jgi:Ca-activated chloride channel family protein
MACLALISALPGTPAGAQEGSTGWPTEVQVEALDESGAVVTGEVAGRFQARVDGQPAILTEMGEVGDNWRIVMFFDQLLADPLDFGNAALQLAERARELTRLGPVEIVLAGNGVKSALPPTRESDVLQQALHWLRLRESTENLQREMRLSFAEELEGAGRDALDEEAAGSAAAELESRARIAIDEETSLLREFREQLLLWVAENPSDGPAALFLIGSGFDAEPHAYYQAALARAYGQSAAGRLEQAAVQPSMAELSQALAAYGWVVLPYVPLQRDDALLEAEEGELATQEGEDKVDVIFQDGRLVDRTTVGIDPRKLLKKRRQDSEEEATVLLDGLAPLQELASATGGELVRGKFQLTDLVNRLPQRHRLEVDRKRTHEGGLLSLDVQLQPSNERGAPKAPVLRARKWLTGQTPELVSAVRARKYLDNELDEGELPLLAALQPGSEGGATRLLVQRDAESSGQAAAEGLRVTVAVAREEASPEIFHQTRRGWAMESDAAASDRIATIELSLAERPQGPVVVLVEDLATGVWGGAFASMVEPASAFGAAENFDSLLLPAPKVIHLMAPRKGFAMGRTLFETVVSKSEVAQVDFYLDGEREAVRRAPPFSASLDLGSLPQPRRVEVVAMDIDGRELGRDYLVVNEGSGVFGVRIVQPRPFPASGKPQKLAGPVNVEAEVEPRKGEGIDRVEFYWKDELAATRYAPPYRQRVVIPPEAPKGYIRVVAYLEDGATSEDVVFVNSPGSSERVQVNLMELYVVVTDRRGQPVRGLEKSTFRIMEEDEEQEIATFSDAGELPLTVGLAIDSSASMFVKLPEVQFAASEFLRGLETRRDRAFVVGFGNEPRMTQGTTSDLPEVINSLDSLQPDGQTGIWQAIVYSLVQLQGVPGKKALVVYTDGADEDPNFSFRTCLRFARKVGVPIYIILSNNEIVRTQGKGLSIRGFLERLETLTSSVGGRVFFARVGEDLQNVYLQIDEELRSQYLLGYYSRDAGGREWREVEVDVRGSGMTARTIAGYFR